MPVTTTGIAQIAEVVTTQTINAADFGLVGDGVTDNTAAIRNLMPVAGRKITVSAGHYLTGMFSIPSNTDLTLEPGVVVADTGHLGPYDRLINITESNVRITGYGASIVASRASYTSGEWRHGVFVWGAHNVSIEGLTSSSHGGDGFYIGGQKGQPSTDIVLIDCKARNNRRNGLSITSARRVDVVDSMFTESNGTSPQSGIDLEVHNEYEMLDKIRIVRPKTAYNRKLPTL